MRTTIRPMLIAAFSLLAASAQATSFYIRPFSEFTQSAANIVHARLSNIHTENALTADGGKTIYTYANAEVIEPIKGTFAGPNILIRKVGGSKDGVTLEIPSNVEFTEGEEGVFFLSEIREDHAYEVTGMELGKFGLKDEGGEKILTGGIFNYSHAPKGDEHVDEAHLAPGTQENWKPWSITQLKELVKKQGASPPTILAGKTTSAAPTSTPPTTSQSLPNNALTTPTPQLEENKPETKTADSSAVKWVFPAAAILLALFFFFRKKQS